MGAALIALTSCNDSFLERTPTHDLVSEVYWNTDKDLESYCNGIYNQASDNGTYHFFDRI